MAKLVLGFLAVAILCVGTACSSNPATLAGKSTGNYPEQPSPGDNRLLSGGDTQRTRRDNPTSYRLDANMERHMEESYTPTAPKKGMNRGLDEDSRDRDNLAASEGKARESIDRAEKRLDKNSREGDRERRASAGANRKNLDTARSTERIGESVEEMKQGARRGFENLKENVGSAIDNASDNLKDITR